MLIYFILKATDIQKRNEIQLSLGLAGLIEYVYVLRGKHGEGKTVKQLNFRVSNNATKH